MNGPETQTERTPMNEIMRKTVVYRPKEPILIVEDTKETQALLLGICKNMEIGRAHV